LRRLPEAEVEQRVRQVAALLRIEPKLKNKATHLSGGEMQRVAIARALAMKPALVLADEPTGNLDESNAEAVMALLTQLVRDEGATLVLATHSETVAEAADRRVHLADGRVADDG
jgi:putative ABC transport system ATP-binding protein